MFFYLLSRFILYYFILFHFKILIFYWPFCLQGISSTCTSGSETLLSVRCVIAMLLFFFHECKSYFNLLLEEHASLVQHEKTGKTVLQKLLRCTYLSSFHPLVSWIFFNSFSLLFIFTDLFQKMWNIFQNLSMISS